MAHDIFVSYSSKDKPVADAVVAGLEQKGIRCWIAPRDLTPGVSWGKGISDAIEQSKVMVVILSENSNNSRQVAREVERAVSTEVVVIPLRIQNIDPTGAIAYFLSSEHWLDAITPPIEKHIDKLGSAIQIFLTETDASARMESVLTQPQDFIDEERVPQKSPWSQNSLIGLLLGSSAVLVVCIAVVVIAFFVIMSQRDKAVPNGISEDSTPTETASPTMTMTPTETVTPTVEITTPAVSSNSSVSIPEGWIDYASDDFSIAFPESWEAVDIDQEGFEAMMAMVNEYDPTLAESPVFQFTEDDMEAPVFFAMDTNLVGMGHANVSIMYEYFPIPFLISDLCAELETVYSQVGLEVIETNCNFMVNNLKSARFTVRLIAGSISMKQYQYLFLKGRHIWVVTMAVEDAYWSQYQPDFVKIAETFRVHE